MVIPTNLEKMDIGSSYLLSSKMFLISINITKKLRILCVHILRPLYPNYNIRNYHIRKLFSWLFTYNCFISTVCTELHYLSNTCLATFLILWLESLLWRKKDFLSVFGWNFITNSRVILCTRTNLENRMSPVPVCNQCYRSCFAMEQCLSFPIYRGQPMKP